MPPQTNPKVCGACMMCCKVFTIDALAKSAGVWCAHAVKTHGCAIYAARPQSCAAFLCQWRLDPALGPEWKPDKARFVLFPLPDGNWSAGVDPATPAAWRAEPYYPHLKLMASRLAERSKLLIVVVRGRWTVVLPDRNVELGEVPLDKQLVLITHHAGGAPTYDVELADR